ncbi:2'-5' RNA ligase family protein [Nitrospirota bacterium]
MRYSLWIEPPLEVADKYLAIIDGLAIRYEAEFFDPHLTLYTTIIGDESEVVKTVEALASEVKAIEIHLGALESGDEFYRALYISADETPSWSDAFARADNALRAFTDGGPRIAPPHMSLLYADMEEDEKRKIMNVLGREFNDTFICNTFSLWRTDGMPEEWVKIVSFAL